MWEACMINASMNITQALHGVWKAYTYCYPDPTSTCEKRYGKLIRCSPYHVESMINASKTVTQALWKEYKTYTYCYTETL